MSTKFTLSRADFSRLQRVVARRLRQKRGVLLLALLLRAAGGISLGVAGAILAVIGNANPEILNQILIAGLFVVVALVIAIISPHITQILFRRHILADNGAFLTTNTFEFNEVALLFTSSKGTTELLWSGFLSKAEDAVNHYLFLDACNAVVVPKSAIGAGESEFQRQLQAIGNDA